MTEEPSGTPAVTPSRLDPGAALAVAALVLFVLSLLLPWFGVSVAVGPRVHSGSVGVRATTGLWVLVLTGFVATALATLWRSLAAAAAALLLGALSVAGAVGLVRRFPTTSLPPPAGATGSPADARLVGAALAVLAAGVLAVGVLIHGIVCLRAHREAASPDPETGTLDPR